MLRRAPPGLPAPPAFDMTPMIDVTFQLIIFFMLVMDMSSARYQPLRQPAARNAVDLREPDEVVVNVRGDGRLSVSGKTMSDASLEDLLRAERERRRAGFPVLIRADRSAPFERVQKILVMTQHVGGIHRLRFGAVLEGKR